VSKANPQACEAGEPVFVHITKWEKVCIKHLSGQAVAVIIQRRTKEAGLLTHYRGHSLRKGMVQQAHLAGVSDSAVMATTGHQSVNMLRRYQGQAGLVTRSASKGLLA
jgi:integrase